MAMERCYDAMRFLTMASYHRFIAIVFRFQHARNHGNLTRLCQRACLEFVVGFSNTCEQNETPNLVWKRYECSICDLFALFNNHAFALCDMILLNRLRFSLGPISTIFHID